MEESIRNWMQEWIDRASSVRYENSFNTVSDEWIDIEGVGSFKGLELKTEECEDNKFTVTFTYEEKKLP